MLTAGTCWARVVEGRLVVVPAHEPLLDPVTDVEMAPFWQKNNPEQSQGLLKFFEFEPLSEHSSPGIYIGHLCGYCFTPEKYRENAERLTSYGFECMRSKRQDDGMYWEKWYLPGLWQARGRLKEQIEGQKGQSNKVQLQCALTFISGTVQFGTLDVSMQRMCMVMGD